MEISILWSVSSPSEGHYQISACMPPVTGRSLPSKASPHPGTWIPRVLPVSLGLLLVGSLPSDSLLLFQGHNMAPRGFSFLSKAQFQDLSSPGRCLWNKFYPLPILPDVCHPDKAIFWVWGRAVQNGLVAQNPGRFCPQGTCGNIRRHF